MGERGRSMLSANEAPFSSRTNGVASLQHSSLEILYLIRRQNQNILQLSGIRIENKDNGRHMVL
jgi:hypothetical protein